VNGRFLLDTNIVIALLNRETAAETRLAEATEAYLSSIVLGELYYGSRNSARSKANIVRLEGFAANRIVLPCDIGTAREYGLIRKLLRDKGSPIPENDIWIAATARQHSLTLVTRDAHFAAIDDLVQESW
jgi:tRNA(fMet)-specific endonuclease VapC